ncbi:MAG: lysophospholipid acyltransferase family protein [Pseudomonadota bacterium]
MALIRSLLFTLLFLLSAVVFATAVVLGFWVPYHQRYLIAKAWAHTVLWMLKMICGLSYTVEGKENIPSGGCIAMLKHSSAMETIVQIAVFPHQSWALKHELMWIPIFGWGVALLKPIAVKRGAGRSAVNQMIQRGSMRLKEGIWVMIFPEGTRVAAGETGRFGVGGAALAQRSGAAMVPVAHNAGDYWPRRGWVKKPGVIKFVIGEAIEPGNREPRELTQEVKAWIESNTNAIREEASVLRNT